MTEATVLTTKGITVNIVSRPNVIKTVTPTTLGLVMMAAGPKGAPGDTLTLVAAIPIGGHRAVATDQAGLAIYADNLVACRSVIGISTGAASAGAGVIIRTSGKMTEPSWGFATNKGLFLGENGLIVQDVPDAGAVVSLGFVVNPITIYIKISERVERNGN